MLSEASESAPCSAEAEAGAPEQLLKRLGRRYAILLAAVAAVVVIDQVVIQPALVRLNFAAPVINVAGRQRMLSQKLTKAALALESATSPQTAELRRAELAETLQQWTTAHQALLGGDVSLGLPATTAPEILAAFEQITPHYLAMREAGLRLTESPAPLGNDTRDADGTAKALAAPAAESAVQVILRHENRYLPLMDHIVGLYERQASQQIVWLRVSGLSLMATVLGLMLGVGWLVLRPATETIQRQLQLLTRSRAGLLQARDELEARVLLRTEELTVANRALQQEIRDREQAEERTQQLSLQLSHAARITAIGQLATGLAHEINQPLAAITNYAEAAELALAATPPVVETAQRVTDRIKKSALRAGDLVRSMRNFVRPGDQNYQPTDLRGVITEVCELCAREIADAGASLVLELPATLPEVSLDRIQIQQVLLNLLQNAWQAMLQADSADRRIWLRASTGEGKVQVEVADTGPGFANAAAETAFQPFYTTKQEGLGMGLAISRSIVQRHAGELSAGNRAGGGALVTFTLPCQQLQSHDSSNAHGADCLRR